VCVCVCGFLICCFLDSRLEHWNCWHVLVCRLGISLCTRDSSSKWKMTTSWPLYYRMRLHMPCSAMV
jgi:hypothetical protein